MIKWLLNKFEVTNIPIFFGCNHHHHHCVAMPGGADDHFPFRSLSSAFLSYLHYRLPSPHLECHDSKPLEVEEMSQQAIIGEYKPDISNEEIECTRDINRHKQTFKLSLYQSLISQRSPISHPRDAVVR